jgi:hypothetical protein
MDTTHVVVYKTLIDPVWIQVLLSVVLVGVTITYAILTRRIAKANESAVEAMRAQADVMREQAEYLVRPYITVTHNFSGETTAIRLCIANTGRSNAEKLRLSIDKDFCQFGRKDHNLADVYVFQNTIEHFAPDAKLFFPILSSLEVQERFKENPLTPFVFTITATYSFAGKTVTEKTTVDLRIYRGIWMPPATIQEKLTELTKELKDFKDTVYHISEKSIQKNTPRKKRRSA